MVKILQVGDPVLEQKSRLVEDPKLADIQMLIGDLTSICKKKAKKSAGLSAPQIGKNLRLFVARRVDLEDKYKKSKREIPEELSKRLWEPVINPRILKVGKSESTYWEGCLSVGKGDDAIFGPVNRPSLVKIKYEDRYGDEKILTAVGFFAHVIQHEIDHLNGILFIKYIKNPKNLRKSKDLDDYIKKYGTMPEVV
jgi:peptide deformylase